VGIKAVHYNAVFGYATNIYLELELPVTLSTTVTNGQSPLVSECLVARETRLRAVSVRWTVSER
jgi:hypothetical protein